MQYRREITGRRQGVAKVAPRAAAIAAFLLAGVAASSARAQPCADVAPPVLVITSPARGETIEQGGTGDDTVVVSGFAQDAESNLVSLVIDGQEQLSAPATGMVPFAVPTPSPWGLSIVTASAEDACGNRAELAQSYLRSGAYFAAPTDAIPDARVAGALELHANQVVLDDGDRGDPDDLTTLIDDGIPGIDWTAAVPNPVLSQPPSGRGCSFPNAWTEISYDVQHGTISVTKARLQSLTAAAGGLQGQIALDALHLPLSAHVANTTCVLGVGPTTIGPVTVTGSVDSQSLTGTASVALRLDPIQTGRAQAPVSSSLDLSTVTISLDCGGFPAFVCDAVDSIASLLRPQLATALDAMLSSLIEQRVESLLNGLLVEPPDLPPFLAVTLGPSAFDRVSADAGGVDLGLATQVRPNGRGAAVPADARGAIRRDGAPPSGVVAGSALEVAVKDDLVNELLWATWYGGGFDLPDLGAAAQSLGFPVESLSMRASLPPVMQPGATPGVAELGLGDVLVHATVDLAKLLGPLHSGLLTVDFYVSALLDGRIGFAPPSRLRFDVDSARVATQILSASDRAQAEAVRSSLEKLATTVAQAVVDRVLGGVPVPSFDLGAQGTGLPPGTRLGLGNGAIDRPSADYTRLAADVVAVYAAKDTLGVDASTCSSANGWVGYSPGVGYLFTPQQPIAATALGAFTMAANLSGDVVVALYDVTAGGSEQDLLAERTLSVQGEPAVHALPMGRPPFFSSADVFYHRAPLESPVPLQPGRQYGIVAWDETDTDGVLFLPIGATVATAIRYDLGGYGSGAQSSPGHGMIGDLDGTTTLGATFEFTPEPGSVASALVAIAALCLARRLRGRA